MTGRFVPEWIGRTADSAIPPHVRLRVYLAHDGRCHIAGRKILRGEPWECDHVIALADWMGEGHGNRESNLAPALKDKHRAKTSAENTARADIRRAQSKDIGIKTGNGFRQHPTLVRGVDGQVRERRRR